MSATVEGSTTLPKRISNTEKIVDFMPERAKASFFLRCGALLIDYMVFLAVPLIWLVSARLFGEGGVGGSLTITSWVIGGIVSIVNMLLLPMAWGKTIGKMISGITIVRLDGLPAGIGSILLRNTVGYLATLLTLGLGFLIAGVNNSGRALHDVIARTIVVQGRKRRL